MVDSQKVVGVSALVFQGNREVYFGAFGLADRENNKPMARDTVVQIFSMTKPVTGVALMKLFERGKFELDDPLEQYVPEFANLKVYAGVDASGQPMYEAPKRKVTMRDVLRHTAGFTSGDGDQTAVGAIYRELNPRAFTQHAGGFRAEVRAGAAGLPAGDALGVFRRRSTCRPYLVQKLSGVPFDKFLDLHIFKPLGMTVGALHHPAHRSRTGRSSRPCTRATRTAASRARQTRKPTSSTAQPGR